MLAEHAVGRDVVAAPGQPPPRSARFQGLPMRAEAWPRPAEPLHDADSLVDDQAGPPQFTVDAEMRPPWSFIFRMVEGVPEVAAIGIASVDGAAGPKDVTILTHPTNAPLTRAAFRQFIEESQRAGIGVVQREGDFTILVLDTPVRAAYLWVRVTSTRGGEPLALSEIAAYSPAQLAEIRENLPAWARLVPLHDVDTSPYQGINLVGLPDLSGGQPPRAEDLDAEGALQQVETRTEVDDEVVPRDHDEEGDVP